MGEINIKALKQDIKNILIIRRNNIGDMVCAIPILRTMRREFPQSHITVLADSTNAGIIEGASFIDKVIIYRKGNGIYKNKYIGHWNLLRQNKQKFDIAIALKIGYSSLLALITLISNARIRIGCIPEKWHPLQICYNLPVSDWRKWKSMHQVDAFFEFIKTVGIENLVKDISIEISPDSINKVREFYKEKKIQKDNIVVFNISNNKPENTWPLERFKETTNVLSKQYKIIYIITSTPPDRDKTLRLTKELDINTFYFETPKVMDFAAVVSESNLLICGEGGAMHIGVGVHVPTISLWGKFRPVKWMPYGEKQFVVKKDEHVQSISAGDILEVIKKNNLLK
jgi:ADP-heptose:LPS heptosyltransferase